MDLSEAHEVVQRMKTAKPFCTCCERIGFKQPAHVGRISHTERTHLGHDCDPEQKP